MGGMRRVVILAAIVLLLVLFLTHTASDPAKSSGDSQGVISDGRRYPPGFTDTLVGVVPTPTAIAFTPDGRMLVATQTGMLLVHSHGKLRADPALDLSTRICSWLEQGLLGIALHSQFRANGFVYLFYTLDRTSDGRDVSSGDAKVNCAHRVSRWTMRGDRIDPSSELVLLDNIPSPNGNHNAGDLHFGKDGLLYVSVGDGGCDYAGGGCAGGNDASRDPNVLQGKILRITDTGGIPAGNPFVSSGRSGSARCSDAGRTEPGKWCAETFAWGLRNPFRLAFDPNSAATRFYINDAGQDQWEEIDEGSAGADYGWNTREGHCANGSTTACGPPSSGAIQPLYDYHHDAGCTVIAGGTFVPAGMWPKPYDGSYLFADFMCGTIFRLVPTGAGSFRGEPFATGLGGGSGVYMTFGPSGSGQALYYATYANGGEIRRIDYAGRNEGGSRP